jgi:nucleotide-binding universal stress UspA family protein
MVDSMLVPTDGSAHAVAAAKQSFLLAEGFDATVHVLNVVDVQQAAGLFDAGGVPPEFIERLKSDGETAVQSIATMPGAHGTVQTAVREGAPGESIREYVTEKDIDLVAMGTHGRRGVERIFLGSVTESVVSRSPVPVLSVRATESTGDQHSYDEILLATDGSDQAAAAAEWAMTVAAVFDARLHALTVLDSGQTFGLPNFTAPGDVLESVEIEGESVINAVVSEATDRGIEAQGAVLKGAPATEIRSYASENDVGLVVMGTTGRSGLKRHLLGSTTARILRRSEVPVLSVGSGEA